VSDGALRPSNAKRLYTEEKSTEIGDIKDENRKVKRRKKENKKKEVTLLIL